MENISDKKQGPDRKGSCWNSLSLGVFQRPLTLIRLQKYRDTNGRRIVIQIGGVYTTFRQKEGILLQKYRDRNGRCIAILFRSIRVRGPWNTPDSLFCSCHPIPSHNPASFPVYLRKTQPPQRPASFFFPKAPLQGEPVQQTTGRESTRIIPGS